MHKPKINILRKRILDAKGHFGYFRVGEIMNLNNTIEYSKKGKLYPNLEIKSEKQMITFIYKHFGPGDYIVQAFLKGREGLFVFWRGEINDEGWIFQIRSSKDRDVLKIEKDLIKANDEETKKELQDDLEFFKEMAKEDSKNKRYGFYPFLVSSGKRGIFHSWEEPDEAFIERKFKDINKVKVKSLSKEPTIEEMNDF